MATERIGFTLVELMTVIAIISILATIGVLSYGHAQERAREGSIDSDMRSLSEAIQVARVRQGKTLADITGNYWTGHFCMFQASDSTQKIPDGTDFSQKNAMTQACWDDYTSALDKISIASGDNVRDMLDPWGRPYYIDENDFIGGPCNKDVIGWLSHPYKGGYSQNWPEHIGSYDETCYPR